MFYFIFSLAVFATPLTLSESLALVEENNIELQISRLQTDKANLAKLSMLSRMLPTVEGKASWLDFGEPLEVNLMGEATQEMDCTSFEAFGFGDLCSSLSEPMLLREARIFDGTIQALYPLSALYSITQGYQASLVLSEISELQVEEKKVQIQMLVIEMYMEALHLQQIIEFAEATQKRMQFHKKTVSAFVEQELLHPIEIQRIENAILDIQIGTQEAQNGYALLCEHLELLIGSPVEPIPLEQKLLPIDEPSNTDNHSIKISHLQAEAANHGTKAAYGQLLPNIVLMTAGTKAIGQGTLTPTSQQYVGLAVTGNFNWGDKWLQAQQSNKDAQMANKAVLLQQEALLLQQQSSYNAWQISTQRLELAKQKSEVAKESRRQADSFHKQHLITTTELLSAENEYLKSQLDIAAAQSTVIIMQARYQQTISQQPFQFK
jgi:outer membrane protein TolC